MAFCHNLKLNYLCKNAWLPPIFFLDTQSSCQVLLSPRSFKPRKNIPALVVTNHTVGNPSISRCA